MAYTLAGFAGHLVKMAAEMPMAEKQALEASCQIIETESKRVLGTHDYGWPELKPETIARKAKGDTPLLETGEMRDSIHHTVMGSAGYVGSDNDKALWHEFGTSKVPPRPFLSGAAMHKEKEVHEVIGNKIVAALLKR
jgi:HK97 gp10 family phage protein